MLLCEDLLKFDVWTNQKFISTFLHFDVLIAFGSFLLIWTITWHYNPLVRHVVRSWCITCTALEEIRQVRSKWKKIRKEEPQLMNYLHLNVNTINIYWYLLMAACLMTKLRILPTRLAGFTLSTLPANSNSFSSTHWGWTAVAVIMTVTSAAEEQLWQLPSLMTSVTKCCKSKHYIKSLTLLNHFF